MRLLKCKSAQLIDYEIKNGTKVICDSAFQWYNSLQQVLIPNSVTCIGDYAFNGCKSLKRIDIQNTVTHIGINPFMCCNEINIKSESNRFVLIDEMLIDNKEKRLIGYFGHRSSVTIPHSVYSIGDWAFESCSSLSSIYIPENVKVIGDCVFFRCGYMTIKCVGENIKLYETKNKNWNCGMRVLEKEKIDAMMLDFIKNQQKIIEEPTKKESWFRRLFR